MFKVNIRQVSQWQRSGVFFVNFEHILHLVLVLLNVALEPLSNIEP